MKCTCPNCDYNPVSEEARACPSCGKPYAGYWSKEWQGQLAKWNAQGNERAQKAVGRILRGLDTFREELDSEGVCTHRVHTCIRRGVFLPAVTNRYIDFRILRVERRGRTDSYDGYFSIHVVALCCNQENYISDQEYFMQLGGVKNVQNYFQGYDFYQTPRQWQGV